MFLHIYVCTYTVMVLDLSRDLRNEMLDLDSPCESVSLLNQTGHSSVGIYQEINREQTRSCYSTVQTLLISEPSCQAWMSCRAGQGAQSSFSLGTNSKGAKESNLEKKSRRRGYGMAWENQERLGLGRGSFNPQQHLPQGFGLKGTLELQQSRLSAAPLFLIKELLLGCRQRK